jgi:hypothetical protein
MPREALASSAPTQWLTVTGSKAAQMNGWRDISLGRREFIRDGKAGESSE